MSHFIPDAEEQAGGCYIEEGYVISEKAMNMFVEVGSATGVLVAVLFLSCGLCVWHRRFINDE